jgi:putative transposase
MPYPPRQTPKGMVFHVLNRAVQRRRLFDQASDYEAFMRCLSFAHARAPVDLFAFCVMPNHFHLIMASTENGQISRFMRLLEGTHGKRWHVHRQSAGTGAVYQARFKAFPIQSDRHFLVACRYVERNALRAKLVARAEDWIWCSLAQRQEPIHTVRLSEWPVARPYYWLQWVNDSEPSETVDALRTSVITGRPFGERRWVDLTARSLGIEERLSKPGRPAKNDL